MKKTALGKITKNTIAAIKHFYTSDIDKTEKEYYNKLKR